MFNNEYKEFDSHVEMYLTRKDKTVVTCILDKKGLEKLKRHDIRWYAHYDPKMEQFYVVGYVRGSGRGGKKEKLHRFLMNPNDSELVDHINGNTLDNRLDNLRVASPTINQHNRKMNKRNTSGYRNVRYRKDRKKWEAYITIKGKYKNLGAFSTPEEASKVAEGARKNITKERLLDEN